MNWVLKNVFMDESILIKKNQFIIGRDKDYDLVCRSAFVSRLHAKIFTLSNGNLQIVNYSTSNGTYVNNTKVFDKELKENDEIGFGLHRLDGFHENYKPPYYIYKLQQLITQPVIKIESDNEEQKVDNIDEVSKSSNDIQEKKVCEKKVDENNLIHNERDEKSKRYETKEDKISPSKSKNSNKEINILDNMRVSISNHDKKLCENKINENNLGHGKNEETNKDIYTIKTSKIKMQKKNSSKEFVDYNKNGNRANSNKTIDSKKVSNKIKEPNINCEKLNKTVEENGCSKMNMQKNDSSKQFVDNKIGNKANSNKTIDSKNMAEPNINCEILNKAVEENGCTTSKKDRAVKKKDSTKKRPQTDKDSFLGARKKRKFDEKSPPLQKELEVVIKKFDSKMKGELEIINKIEAVSKVNGDKQDQSNIVDSNKLDFQDEPEIPSEFEKPSTSTAHNTTANNSYSFDDNIIVVDDNADDDLDFVCSQLFIKPEPVNKLTDELFMNIKKEVAEMDDYEDISRMPTVIIDDSMDIDASGFESDELLSRLNDAIGDAVVPTDVAVPNVAEQKINEELQPSTSGLRNNKKTIESAASWSNIKKPDIIEALPLAFPTKRKGKATSGNTLSKTKTKTKENDKSKNNQGSPKKKKLTKETRKQKLKELAEKEAASKQPKQIEHHKANTKNKIKVSASRGDFLLEQNQKNNTTTRLTRSSRNNSTSTFYTSLPSKSTSPIPFIGVNNDSFRLAVPSYNAAPSSNYRSISNETAQLLDKYRDIIETMINWNIMWFSEYKYLKTPPPVTHKPVIRMCNTFSSYKDYRAVLEPLMILNYWFTIASAFEGTDYNGINDKRNTFVGLIEQKTSKERHTELLCTTYLTAEQSMKSIHLKEKSFVLVNVRIKGNQKQYKSLSGVASWVSKEKLTKNDQVDEHIINGNTIPTTKLKFLLIVKKCDAIINELHICVRYFIEYSTLLRSISAVRSIENSPLLSYILEPNLKDYYMPLDPNELKIKRDLNKTQLEAVMEAKHLALSKNAGIYLIEGPPGTGKSNVILSIVLEVLLNTPRNGCILLLAPSNGAIDSLMNTYLNKIKGSLSGTDRNNIRLVRIGLKISSNLKHYSLDSLAEMNLRTNFLIEYPQAKNDYNILQADIRKLEEEMNAKPSHDIRTKLNAKLLELENFVKSFLKCRYHDKLEEQKKLVLEKATVICSTIGSVHHIYNKHGLPKYNIKLCIIDEATQCLEPETLIPIKMGVKKLILVGDPQQLPAVTSSTMSKEFGYDKSLFARIKLSLNKSCISPIKLLNIQYRMNPEINSYPNRKFYNGEVKDALNFSVKRGLEKLVPYIVFERNQPFTNEHYYNIYEVNYIILLIQAILDCVKIKEKLSIGIITPYTKQKETILDSLRKQSYSNPKFDITCNTVDSFQGQEKDIIILSTVRNTPNLFSQDLQRLNVALTRAKYALYIIGSKNLLDSCRVLRELKEDARSRNFFHSLTEEINSPTAFSKLIIKR